MGGEFQTADYVLCGVTLVMAVTGLFRGFSGTLGFALATLAAAAVSTFGWVYSSRFTQTAWLRAACVLVAALLMFGTVRLAVKKLVNGLLAQPSDALFGMLTGAGIGALLLLAWAYSGAYLEYSALAGGLADYVR
ncbi:MAG: hypothetical protein J6T01_03425 [Kiritimatiellae bacterium]|nr:hypothetical protein [Kiritimatiellia bacterium]